MSEGSWVNVAGDRRYGFKKDPQPTQSVKKRKVTFSFVCISHARVCRGRLPWKILGNGIGSEGFRGHT